MLVYKVFRETEMRAFLAQGRTSGAPVDLVDGYIHLSTSDQLAETLARHFAGENDLHLLAIETENLSDLRWEPSRGGALFPHLYRDLSVGDVRWSRLLPLTANGHQIGELG